MIKIFELLVQGHNNFSYYEKYYHFHKQFVLLNLGHWLLICKNEIIILLCCSWMRYRCTQWTMRYTILSSFQFISRSPEISSHLSPLSRPDLSRRDSRNQSNSGIYSLLRCVNSLISLVWCLRICCSTFILLYLNFVLTFRQTWSSWYHQLIPSVKMTHAPLFANAQCSVHSSHSICCDCWPTVLPNF